MKKLLLGVCLLGLAVACKTSGADMSDSSSAGKDCTGCSAEEMKDCPECSADMKAECKEKCEGEQVCPVTGKSMN